MKKTLLISVIFAAMALLLFGCTQVAQNGSGLMGDTNKSDSNNGGTSYSNLDKFTQIARENDNVSVEYTLKKPDGNVIESNVGKSLLSFTVGAHEVITGFEKAIIGMKIGDTKTVTLPPKEAYGEYDENKVIKVTVDKNQFDDFNNLLVGSDVTGNNIVWTVIEKTDNNAVLSVNTNPPLAGQTLVFEIKLISINQ